jgi:hypothetical protein
VGLAVYALKLYRYLCSVLREIFARNPKLAHNFDNSIFLACTYNLGPHTVTVDHLDIHNLVHCMCGVTAFGDFDHKLGAHLHLKQLGLYFEFPSGSSVLIPSACLDHGNTPIQPGETRTSFTQYAAGGLFRWASYGHQTAKSLMATPQGRAAKATIDGAAGSCWEWALGLFSKYDDVDADRKDVFGS